MKLILFINFVLPQQMFRYIKIGKILKEVIERGKQLKSALYNTRQQLKEKDVPMAYSLLSFILNNFDAFKSAQEQIMESSKAKATNPYLMYIMMAELINIGKIVGGGQLKRIIVEHQHLLPKLEKQSKINKQKVQIRLRKIDKDFDVLEKHLSKIGTKDAIIPNLYHLPQESYSQLTKNSELNILYSSACVMQSFSSSLPSYLLLKGVQDKWKHRRYDIIDACSAPGNKTVQLAEYNNKGKVFAYQKNQRRFELLKKTVQKYQSANIIPKNGNFLELSQTPKLKRVKFILLDPSCSGSGMLTNFIRDGNKPQDITVPFQTFCDSQYIQLTDKQKKRVQNLHNFQIQLLNHAATFRPLRLSYSTCSIYKRENEDVVREFLNQHPQYKIKQYKKVKNSQLLAAGFGKQFRNCIRVDPRKMESDGFFVTVFTRRKVIF